MLTSEGHPVPFKARLEAQSLLPSGVTCPAGSFPGKFSLVGNATHLGKFTGEGSGCSAFTSATTFVFTAAQNLYVAANGDEIWLALDPAAGGSGWIEVGASGPVLRWTANKIITGGTGRFAGATGSVVEVGWQPLAPNAEAKVEVTGSIDF